jgi:hypothetical protein
MIWLSLLAVKSAYGPRADGIAGALTFVDGLLALGRATKIGEVIRQLPRYGLGGRIGYKYDPRRGGSKTRQNNA